ncbi:MAG: response regulator [Deltaproteobacteria bacterium]|nr:response regulator [Deltaproteobacteria bacterium]
MEEFDRVLRALRDGGIVEGEAVSRLARPYWDRNEELARLWDEGIRPNLNAIVGSPTGRPGAYDASVAVEARLDDFADRADALAKSLRGRTANARAVLGTLAVAFAFANGILVFLGFRYASRRIVGPVLQTAAAARRASAGDFSVIVTNRTNDELSHLADAFNAMTKHISVLLDRLEQRRRHAETLSQSLPLGVVLLDENLAVVRANDTFRDLLANETGAAAADAQRAIVSSVDLSASLNDVLATGESMRGRRFDWPTAGGAKAVRMTAARANLSGDESAALIVVLEDLTEEDGLKTAARLADEEMRRSEAKYQRLVEGLRQKYFFYRHGTDGRFTYVSPSVEDVLGYSPGEFLADFRTFLTDHPVNIEVERFTERSIAGIGQPPYVLEILAREGGPRWLEVLEVPVFRGDGAVECVEGIAHDITDGRRAEETKSFKLEVEAAISRAAKRYLTQTSLDGAIDRTLEEIGTLCGAARGGLYRFDLEDRTMSNTNEWCAEGLSSQKEQLQRIPLARFPRSLEHISRGDSIHIPDARQTDGDFEDLRRLMLKLNVDSAVVLPVLVAGKLSGALAFSGVPHARCGDSSNIDMLLLLAEVTGIALENEAAKTRASNLEHQLVHSQKMEAVGRLAGGVAHDFNNLLQVILGFAELIHLALDPNSPIRDDLNEIVRAAETAKNLTKQLLAFSRKQILEPRVLDLGKTVSSSLKMLGRLIGEDIEIAFVEVPDLWKTEADPAQIDQILANLAINARDAMPTGGRLTIETSNHVFDEDYCRDQPDVKLGEFVVLAVSDTGIGMPPEVRDRIFEPFFTTKERGRGTGLGLASVYGVVKQHNGFVNVYSEPGRGTTFRIYFPRSEKCEATGEMVEAQRTLGGNETVLLVEDQDMVRGLARRMLMQGGYQVLDTQNGRDALDLTSGFHGTIHLLLTDVVMPGMSGKDLYSHLSRQVHDLRVVYMSGYTGNAIVHHGVLDPGIVFVSKPFSKNDLLSAVRTALDRDVASG